MPNQSINPTNPIKPKPKNDEGRELLSRDDLNKIRQMGRLISGILHILESMPLDADELNRIIQKFEEEYHLHKPGDKPIPLTYYQNLN